MKIALTLNNSPIVIDADPSEMLIVVLRKLKYFSVKLGCSPRNCGVCTVLLNDRAVPSCRLPVGLVRDSDVVTLEYFEQTEFYKDIMKGFEMAGIHLCGYCNAGKIFAAYEIIKYQSRPTRESIYEFISHLDDCCVERDTLINGILHASSIHFEREKLRKNGK